jgi:hypothetical protein
LGAGLIFGIGDWWNETTGADLPKVLEQNGVGQVTYKGKNPDAIDFTNPQPESQKVAEFVYPIAKFNSQLRVLKLTIDYRGSSSFSKEATIDDLEWVRDFKTKEDFSAGYAKYFANILFQHFIEAYNASLPGVLRSIASGEIDATAVGQTKGELMGRAIQIIPNLDSRNRA